MGSWNLGYDQLNRLTSASGSAAVDGVSSLNWTYDSFGNRLTQTGNGGMNVSTQIDTTNGTHNQITLTNVHNPQGSPTSVFYDAAGNLQNDGSYSYLYDAEGRLCAVNNGSQAMGYLYDAAGRRVAKGTITSWSCDPTNNFTETTRYILGPNGEQMTEMAVSGGTETWVHTNVPAGDLVATYMNDGQGPHFRIADWLGTTRVQTNSAGSTELLCQSLPFGDPATPCTVAPGTEEFFTGYERDPESGNDFAQARHYASGVGRFLSPDPSGLYYADPANPQSFNLYAYVRNNPLSNIDPSGLYCQWSDGSVDSSPQDGGATYEECVGDPNNEGTWIEETTVTVRPDGNSGCTGMCGEDPMQWLTDWGIDQFNALQQLQGESTSSPEAFAQGVIKQIAKNTAGFPNVCSLSFSARAQVPFTPISAGASVDGSGNVSASASWKQAGAPGGPSISLTGRANSKSAAVAQQVSIPVLDTGVSATVGINPFGRNSYGLSAGVGKYGSVSGSGTFGTMGNPTCH